MADREAIPFPPRQEVEERRAVDRRKSARRSRFVRDPRRLRRSHPAGGRSETVRGLDGDGRDERFRQIDIHATALAGLAVIFAVIVALIVELARGHDGNPYGWLGAMGGLTYIAAIIVFRIRG